jgi:hypothetical protein
VVRVAEFFEIMRLGAIGFAESSQLLLVVHGLLYLLVEMEN